MTRARPGRQPRRGPRHAHTAALASTRTALGAGALAVLAAGALTASATATGTAVADVGANAHRAPARVAAPMAAPAPAAAVGLDGPPLSAADLAALGKHKGSKPRALTAPPEGAPASGLAASGIPVTALEAYQRAARREAQLDPSCALSWPLLAGIGRVESDHGRFAGAVLHSDGLSTPRIIGIPLNGHGTAMIADTDGGRLDGDPVYDRAVGPMQFIPSTWAGWGVDANGDGVKDPFNIFDAAAAAADYLCAAGGNLSTTRGQVQAILSYNYSFDYVSLVMGVERIYASGVGITVPVLPTSIDGKQGRAKYRPTLPPVDPGAPRGVPDPAATPRKTSKTSKVSAPSTGPSSTAPSGGGSGSSSAPTPAPSTSASQPPTDPPSSSSSPSPAPTDPSSSSSPAPAPSSSGSSSTSPDPSPTGTTSGP
jgi:membrane-bound lytic murein transglycosylase B